MQPSALGNRKTGKRHTNLRETIPRLLGLVKLGIVSTKLRRIFGAACAAVLSTSLLAVPAASAQSSAQSSTENNPSADNGGNANNPDSASEGSRFTIGVLPDTQFYSRYSTPETGNLAKERYGSEPFTSQTQWLVDNQDALNMQFVTQLGDIVDQQSVEGEWKVADAAMKILDDSPLNYSIAPGNHDMSGDGVSHPFDQWFPASRAQAANDTFQERHTEVNADAEYHIFNAQGQDYLVLALPWRAPDNVLDWAQGVIDKNPELPVIVTTHEILQIDGEGQVSYSEEYGQHLWDKLIAPNDQIFLTIAGHNHGAGYRVDKNNAGHDVVSILQDYQMAYQGGNGLLGVLEFDLSGNELEMAALSPWVAAKPADELTQFDQLILDSPGDSYHVPLNFAERFADFAPDFQIGSGNEGDLAQTAKDIVSEGYKPYTISEEDLPQSTDDFVKNDRTVFHWRPGETTDANGKQLTEGQAAGAGSIIPDIAGDGDLYRQPGSLPNRVTYSKDHHPLSSDSGSLYWSDPQGLLLTAEFSSLADASINSVDTTAGYTFESFVKLPADFNGSVHGWGNAVTRNSSIADLVEGSTDTDPTVMFGVSNLRELRWWAEPKEGSGSTVWSHEVPTDEWMHIAVVNDPTRDTVEMFINGAPILRNAAGAEGLLPRDLQWVMGAGRSNMQPQDPWYGWIGETRLTQGVLDESQWLTARSHEDSDASSSGSSDATSSGSSKDSDDSGDSGTPGSASSASSDSPEKDNAGQAAGAIFGVVALLAAIGALGYAAIPVLNRELGLNISLPKIPGLPDLSNFPGLR